MAGAGCYIDIKLKVWTQSMLFGNQAPRQIVKDVKISDSLQLLFVLDSVGRISVINPFIQTHSSTTDSNTYGHIFLYKHLENPFAFHLLPYPSCIAQDSV
jgi:hypothetical protein